MEKRGFFVLVLAFFVLASFVFYLDVNQSCGSFSCVLNYLFDSGEVSVSEDALLAPEDLFDCTFVTQYGITWTFDTVYQCGYFANGDPFVVGPVKIVSMDPPFVSSYIQSTTSCNCEWGLSYCTGGDIQNNACAPSLPSPYLGEHPYSTSCTNNLCVYEVARNGWMNNPTSNSRQSYDNRIAGYRISATDILPPPELNNYIAQPGSSIIKSTSITLDCPGSTNPTCLQKAAVLTVIDSATAVNADTLFRPGYFGTTKTYYSAANLRTDLLPQLSGPTSTPPMQEVTDRVSKLQLDHLVHWSARAMHPIDNMPNYGREISVYYGMAALRLLLDDTIQEKLPLAIAFTQVGIDHYSFLINGGSWPAAGGHTSGRKIPIVFAGFLLDNNAMKNIALTYIPSTNTFQEDSGVFYISQADVDRRLNTEIQIDVSSATSDTATGTINFNLGGYDTLLGNIVEVISGPGAGQRKTIVLNTTNGDYQIRGIPIPANGPLSIKVNSPWSPQITSDSVIQVLGYESSQIGLAEWGIEHALEPNKDNRNWYADYRQCCTAIAWTGFLLAAKVLGLQTAWNNPAAFDYQERYMQVTSSTGAYPGWRSWDDFAVDMYDTYWDQYPNSGQTGNINFDLSVNPSSGSVYPGQTTQTQVNANYISGAAEDVVFSVSNLPNGVSATFEPDICSLHQDNTCTSVMTIIAASNANPVVSQPINIIGASGSNTRQVTYSLTVNAIQPNAPTISRIVNDVILNNIDNSVELQGANFDPLDVLYDGVPIDRRFWTFVNSSLIRINVVRGTPEGDYAISVKNKDNLESLPKNLRVNLPFDYLLTLGTSSIITGPGSSFDLGINLESSQFMAHELVNLQFQSSPEITPAFIGNSYCTPQTTCSSVILVNIENILANPTQEYYVDVTGTSELTSVSHTQRFNIIACGNRICSSTAGETCSTCSSDCGACSTSSNSGSSSSGSSGGGGGPRPTATQCSDKKDNDADGKIDLQDKGCTNLADNSELSIDEIVNPENETINENQTEIPEIQDNSTEEEFEIKIVFWIVLGLLLAGIIIVVISILKSTLRKNQFNELTKLANANNSSIVNQKINSDNSSFPLR